MIGSGIFALPSQMAGSAAPGPLIIGWAITGVGMLMLAFVFQTLATRKPDVDGGVYGYARAGFGNYIGFTSAFGYWMSAWVGNVAYLVLLFSTLGYFFPQFEGGTTVPAIIGASSGDHQKSSGSTRVLPSKRKAATSPMFDGLNTCEPR